MAYIPLPSVLTWMELVRPTATQKPTSQMERSLFAIMHLATVNPDEPVSAVWITRTLECLFSSKPGVSFGVLISRIQALHRMPPKQFAFAKRSLQEIYDLRNGFVHGGADFIHPLRLEAFDKHLNEEAIRVFGATDFGYRLIISTLQKILKKRWVHLSFSEVMRGDRTVGGKASSLSPRASSGGR